MSDLIERVARQINPNAWDLYDRNRAASCHPEIRDIRARQNVAARMTLLTPALIAIREVLAAQRESVAAVYVSVAGCGEELDGFLDAFAREHGIPMGEDE